MARKSKWSVQAIIVKKGHGMTRAKAKAKAGRVMDGTPETSRETSTSFRFRQAPPKQFSIFRTKKIGKGVTLVLGKRR